MNHEMRRIAIIILGFCLVVLSAKSQEVVSTGGDFHENSSGSISWTLGEAVTSTMEGGSSMLTQGFQQCRFEVNTLIQPEDPNWGITISPNPAKDFILLRIEKTIPSESAYSVFDGLGNLIRSGKIISQTTKIDFSSISPSMYFIRVKEGDKLIQTFKIVKIY
jgi:hypothetical protein